MGWGPGTLVAPPWAGPARLRQLRSNGGGGTRAGTGAGAETGGGGMTARTEGGCATYPHPTHLPHPHPTHFHPLRLDLMHLCHLCLHHPQPMHLLNLHPPRLNHTMHLFPTTHLLSGDCCSTRLHLCSTHHHYLLIPIPPPIWATPFPSVTEDYTLL